MHFHFLTYFVNSIIFRVSNRLLYSLVLCNYWSWRWKIKNARNVHISSKINQYGIQNSACSHCRCQNFQWYKNPNFLKNKLRMMLHLSSVPLMINKLWNCIYENYMGDVFLECLLLVNYITPYLWLLVVMIIKGTHMTPLNKCSHHWRWLGRPIKNLHK